jgi:hypothetical protein
MASLFWCYTHEDDRIEGERITKLARQLADAFELITAETLELFLDVDSLKWGEAWRERIDQALEDATFFVPVVTPKFLTRPECRRELLRFAGLAKSLGVEEFLLPIHYVNVEALKADDDTDDELVPLLKKTHRTDWRSLRLLDEKDPECRQAVHALATRLAEVVRSHEARPAPGSAEGATPTGPDADDASDEEDAPGLLDLIADGEDAIPRWIDVMTKLSEEIQAIGVVFTEGSKELERDDAAGKGFRGRVGALNRIANRLTPHATQVNELGSAYVTELIALDAAILTMIRLAVESEDESEISEVQEFCASVLGLVVYARGTATSLADMAASAEAQEGMSRALRAPLRVLRAGIRSITDGQAVLDEWERRILESGLISEEQARAAQEEAAAGMADSDSPPEE